MQHPATSAQRLTLGHGLNDIELAEFYGGVTGNGCTPPYDLPGPKLEDLIKINKHIEQ